MRGIARGPMSPLLALGGVLAAMVVLAACGSSSNDDTKSSTSGGGGGKEVKIGAALIGPKNDKSFNQAAYQGILVAQKSDPNLKLTSTLENKETDSRASTSSTSPATRRTTTRTSPASQTTGALRPTSAASSRPR